MTRAIVTTALCAALLGCQAAGDVAPAAQAAPAATPAASPDAISTPASAPAELQQAAEAFDSNRAWEHLRQMVMFGPRPAGSEALRQTRAYITRQLSAVGLTVQEQPFTVQTPIGTVNMVNLAVRLPGRRTDKILITGHYDTKLFREFVFVGASDGASSAAMLIELARVLQSRPREFTYEFVWFDGEEAFCRGWDECGRPGAPDNTYGSRYYVEAAKKANALSSIKAMILLDMVGAKDLKLRKDTDHAAAWLNDIFWTTGKRLGYGNVFIDLPGPVGGDDLYDYPQWHNDAACCDDLDHVAARSLQIVGDVVLAALPEVEKYLQR
jgi:glutaminyl-peptide cyclotransferase